MKCEKAKKAILLDQSGELAPRRQRRLAVHLHGCAECRSFKTSSVYLARAASEHPGRTDLSPHTLHVIREAGRKAVHPPGRRHALHESFGALWRPALVYAAAALIVASAWILVGHRPRATPAAASKAPAGPASESAWDNSLDEEIDLLGESLAMISSDFQEQEDHDDGLTTEDLATELLLWEGST